MFPDTHLQASKPGHRGEALGKETCTIKTWLLLVCTSHNLLIPKVSAAQTAPPGRQQGATRGPSPASVINSSTSQLPITPLHRLCSAGLQCSSSVKGTVLGTGQIQQISTWP